MRENVKSRGLEMAELEKRFSAKGDRDFLREK